MKVSHFLNGCLLFLTLSSCKGGVSVAYMDSGVDFTCRALCAVSDSVLWASGSKGTVLRSVDGGTSWFTYTVADTTNDFRCLYAWDDQTALVFAICDPVQAFKTSDGGATWRRVFYEDDERLFINAMTFREGNDRYGVAIGDEIDLVYCTLLTDDYGETWHPKRAMGAYPGGGGFAASNTNIQFLSDGRVFFASGVAEAAIYTAISRPLFSDPLWASTDARMIWQRYLTPVVSNTPGMASGLNTIYMTNEKRGIVGGGDFLNPERSDHVVAVTQDGGQSWIEPKRVPHGYISCIKPIPIPTKRSDGGMYYRVEDVLLAVGFTGCSISDDFGSSWRPLKDKGKPLTGFHVAAVAPAGKYLYMAGNHGRMARISRNHFSKSAVQDRL